MTNWLNELLFCGQVWFAWHTYLSAASSSLKKKSIFGSIVAQRETLPLLRASCTRHLHVVKEVKHKKMDRYKCCSSFSWFCSSLCFGYQIRNCIQALTHEQRSLSHIPKCTPFYHAHIVQEQSWVSIQCTTSLCIQNSYLGLIQTGSNADPSAHVSWDNQPHYEKRLIRQSATTSQSIIPLRHKLLFPKLRQNWNDSPQSCSIKM